MLSKKTSLVVIILWLALMVLGLNWMLSQGLWVFVAALSIPLIIWHLPRLKHLFVRKRKAGNSDLFKVRGLSDNEIHLLQKHLPERQLPLALEVLIPTLKLLRDTLSKIKTHKGNLWDMKFNQISQVFSDCHDVAIFEVDSPMLLSQQNAILAFGFYRVLFDGVLEQGIAQDVLPADTDKLILLKRISPRLANFMGAQIWRLYELHAVISKDLNDLVINADIIGALQKLCDKHQERPESTLVDNTSVQGGADVEVGTDSDLGEISCQVSDDTPSSVKEFLAYLEATGQIDEDRDTSEQQGSPINKQDQALIDHFNSWIKRTISEHGINSDADYFFADVVKTLDENSPLVFDEYAMFVSEIALHDFIELQGADAPDLKQLLIDLGVFDQRHYEVITSRQKYDAFRVKIEEKYEVERGVHVEIREVAE